MERCGLTYVLRVYLCGCRATVEVDKLPLILSNDPRTEEEQRTLADFRQKIDQYALIGGGGAPDCMA